MYRVPRSQLVYAMSASNPPVLRVEAGASVVFETSDCFENQILSQTTEFQALDWNRINPATGPVYIEGTEPGDILVLHIDRIKVADRGVMLTGPNLGVLGDRLTENSIQILDIHDEQAQFADKFSFPINPMIGVIGTAPAGEAVACGTPGQHGGNMDCKVIREGSTLYLPVNVPGALLALGDLHAVMGDGEVSVCGLEVPGEVTVTITVKKQSTLPLPLVKSSDALYTIASEKTLDEAANSATRQMVHLLTTLGGLKPYEALNLLSLAGNLQICQVVDPLKTVRMELALTYVQHLGIII